ncbi:hypothetical protein [Paenibacillus eucommiae]|uniref:PepSY domain-containing protein n=1 Tax=Paenibacillus eucommiae TaxID=1355755 RepID=A0ABS4ISV6_9BACL|nr:hypothetical protein [Paenibacillus eucommiae]MBP1989669.1 hypothetical protein [Paenibacillus eucommiae]
MKVQEVRAALRKNHFEEEIRKIKVYDEKNEIYSYESRHSGSRWETVYYNAKTNTISLTEPRITKR